MEEKPTPIKMAGIIMVLALPSIPSDMDSGTVR